MSHRELAIYLNPNGPQRREIMAALADAGVRFIGTDGVGWDAEKNRSDIAAFRADLAEFGLVVQSMHALPPLLARADGDAPPDLRDALRRDLQLLASLGGRTAVYHACMLRDVPADDTDKAIDAAGWERFVAHYAATLTWLARQAAQWGITIAIENVWHSRRALPSSGMAELVRAAGEPNIGICLDSGHAHLVDASVAAEIRAAGDLLCDTHFHDNVGPVDGRLFDQHIPPGLGTIDWQEACRALDDIAYPGPVVFEGVLGPGDSIAKGRFGGELSHADLITITIANWRALESFASASRPA